MLIDFSKFQVPILAAACPIEINQKLNILGGIITKTITLNPVVGNPSEVYIEEIQDKKIISLNHIGLDNSGVFLFCEKILPRYLNLETPIIISIYGENYDEYYQILKNINRVNSEKIIGFELNLSCPNFNIKYDFEELKKIVELIHKIYNNAIVSVKINYNFTNENIRRIEYIGVDIINCFNTLPVKFNDLTYGLGGFLLKDKYLKRINDIKKISDLPIIATGGISKKQDIIDYINVGANLVSIGTYFLENSNNIFRLIYDFLDEE